MDFLNENDIKRLNGAAKFDLTIKTFKSVMKETGMSKKELINWAQLNNHEILRLKRGELFRFYIKPNSQLRYFRGVCNMSVDIHRIRWANQRLDIKGLSLI